MTYHMAEDQVAVSLEVHTDGVQIMKIEEADKFGSFVLAADEMERRGGGWVEWWDMHDNVVRRWVE